METWLRLLLLPLLFLVGCRSDLSMDAVDDRGAGDFSTEVVGDREVVVLLHGMGRTRFSMYVMGKRFEKKGYRVLYFSYDIRGQRLDEISDGFRRFIEKEVKGVRYHLVGHSLGNIIVRNAFGEGMPTGLGRFVMLAPPNRVSVLAKRLKSNFVYRWRTGDCGQQLASKSFYESLPLPDCEYGIIAGDRGQRLTFGEANDCIVAVETTRLVGSADWMVLHHSHTFIMNSRDTFEHSYHFLKHGKFR